MDFESIICFVIGWFLAQALIALFSSNGRRN